jgi:hypothetical protein
VIELLTPQQARVALPYHVFRLRTNRFRDNLCIELIGFALLLVSLISNDTAATSPSSLVTDVSHWRWQSQKPVRHFRQGRTYEENEEREIEWHQLLHLGMSRVVVRFDVIDFRSLTGVFD